MGRVTIEVTEKLWFLIEGQLSRRKCGHKESPESFFIFIFNEGEIFGNDCDDTDSNYSSYQHAVRMNLEILSANLSRIIADKCGFEPDWSEWKTGTCEEFEKKYIKFRTEQLFLQKKLWFLIKDKRVTSRFGHKGNITNFWRSWSETDCGKELRQITNGKSHIEPDRYDATDNFFEDIARHFGFDVEWFNQNKSYADFEAMCLQLLNNLDERNRRADIPLQVLSSNPTYSANHWLASVDLLCEESLVVGKWSASFKLNCPVSRPDDDFTIGIDRGYLQLDTADFSIIEALHNKTITQNNTAGVPVTIERPNGYHRKRTWYIKAEGGVNIGNLEYLEPFCELSNLAPENLVSLRFGFSEKSIVNLSEKSSSDVSQVKKGVYREISKQIFKNQLERMPKLPEHPEGWIVLCETSRRFVEKNEEAIPLQENFEE